MSSATAAVSPARVCAYRVLRRVFEQDAYADRALHAEARELDTRDRALATALAYGAVQRRATLDFVAERLTRRPIVRLDPPVRAGLRLGLVQLLLLEGIADHAAVHESVELVKRDSRGGSGLVNAVLRRAAREGREILGSLSDAAPADAAVLHSVPEWLAEMWWDELGADRARSLLAAVNRPAEAALRVNTLVAGVDEVASEIGVPVHRDPELPEALVLDRPFDAHGSAAWARGALMPQSRGSMTAARVLAPVAGDRVLDLCAAPGGKTSHLAALMGDRGEIVAVERHAGRAEALRRTLDRLGARSARVVVADAARLPADLVRGGFDRVLVDPPCSGLGTLQSRPDLRWRAAPERMAELAALQAEILAAGAESVRPGGALVYSVCTISRRESDGVIDAFVAEHRDWTVEDVRRPAPDTDGTDGFFIILLRRPSARYPAVR